MQNRKTPFIFIASLSGFALLTFDLYQPALPYITHLFHTTHSIGQLTLSLYLFIFGLSQLLWGPLVDHFGRQKCLPFSLTLFLIGTLICIFAINIGMLITGRIIQGLSVCCANIVAFSSTRDYEDSTIRARAISHISMAISISPIFAPLIGAILFVHFGWQSNFISMALIALTFLILSQHILHESPYWESRKNDFALRTLFSYYRNVIKHPQLWKGIVIITGSYSSFMIFTLNVAYLVIDELHFSPSQFAFLFAANGLIIIVGNYLGIQLREIYPLRWNMRLGIIIHMLGGLSMLCLMAWRGLSIYALLPSVIITLGIVLTNPPTLSLMLTDFKKNPASAMAIINTSRMSISAVFSIIIGSLISYHLCFLPLTIILIAFLCLMFSFSWIH
ncbi:MFS transporter [Legionella israelensis]|uniref:MFS transporter n=1 Tax=Legionella israelensis TaxID=454 RepID=A0AAX1EGF8_9GAMM|nr:MFS transporter [Legionella israelensis]QBR84173.1 MFS transporter [Legionella israelensis]